MTLASDAIDWIERSMPPSMMTKVTPVARMKSTAVSPASWSSVAGCRKTGWAMPTIATRTTSVASGSHCRSRFGPSLSMSAFIAGAQTMCPMRSTWRGLWPGSASVAKVISPSRITSTVWLRPIVSSSVSEVRMTATPSAVTARTSS